MRFCKVLFFMFAVILCASQVLAGDIFYKINGDLKRAGLEEIEKMGTTGFESGNYRLDPDFRLGYGDTVSLNLWGKLEATHKLTIDRDGNIVIPLVGRVSIIGRSIDEARAAIKQELDKKYSNVEFDLNLTDVQNIRIMVLGNVKNPGPYAVSPFSRVVDAIAKSGGPNPIGSLSDIRLIRDDKQIASFNTYDFILKADQSNNLRLKHGDIIFIPQIKNLIAVRGEVVYPGIYDVTSDTTLLKVIDMAGGMLLTKFERKVSIVRINKETKLTETFKEIIFDSSKGIEKKDDVAIEDQDTIIITTVLDYAPYPDVLFKLAHISGEINMPGDYIIKKGETLRDLIKRAGGLKDTAFAEGAVFSRVLVKEKQKFILDELVRAQNKAILEEEAYLAGAVLTQEEKELRRRALDYRKRALEFMASRIPQGRVIINLEDILNGKSDIILQKEDNIFIPPVPTWVLVTGAVYNPESVTFEEGKPLEYYLNAVGGPNKFADKDDIYIIKADGRVESKGTGYGNISRGDIVVVPERVRREKE